MAGLATYEQLFKTYYSAEDASFVAGDSPVELDVKGTLEREGIDGYIVCDGPGSIIVNMSADGTTYGSNITLKETETLSLRNLHVNKIKITHSGADSAYRVYVI